MKITALARGISKSQAQSKVYRQRWLNAMELVDELTEENSKLRTLVSNWEGRHADENQQA